MVDDPATATTDADRLVYEWPAGQSGFVPARVVADGRGRFYIVGADRNPDPDTGTHADLRNAADAETAGGLPDLDAARRSLYATKATPAATDTDGLLSRLARRALRQQRRSRAMGGDVYTAWEYDGWVE